MQIATTLFEALIKIPGHILGRVTVGILLINIWYVHVIIHTILLLYYYLYVY